MNKKIIISIFVVIAFFTLVFFHESRQGNQKFKSVNVFSKSSTGLSIFYELSDRLNPDKLEVSKKAFFERIDPDIHSAVFILSPKKHLTKREEGLLENYVKEGGTLVLSAVSVKEFLLLKDLISIISDSVIDVEYADQYVNGRLQNYFEQADTRLRKKGELYSIYSSLKFTDETKKSDNAIISPYFLYKKYGQGHLEFGLGYPVFSNTLIGHSNNRNLAYRILDSSGTILVDEYRHLFTEKSMGDLFSTPFFIIPIVGMVLLAILYFIFSEPFYGDFKQNVVSDEYGYHDYNKNIVYGLLKSNNLRKDSVLIQAGILEKIYPDLSNEIAGVINKMKSSEVKDEQAYIYSNKLIKLHKDELKSRGFTNI